MIIVDRKSIGDLGTETFILPKTKNRVWYVVYGDFFVWIVNFNVSDIFVIKAVVDKPSSGHLITPGIIMIVLTIIEIGYGLINFFHLS